MPQKGKNNLLIGVGLFLLAFTIRMYGISSNSIWLDEAWRVSLALNFVDLSALSYHRLLSLMIGLFGKSEFSIRLPSVFFGALSVPAIYYLSQKYISQLLSILVSLVVCLSPYHLTYSTEAAAYTIAGLFTIVFAISLNKLRDSFSFWLFLALLISSYLISVANIYNVLFIFTSIFLLQIFEGKVLKWANVTLFLLLLSLIPNIISHLQPMGRILDFPGNAKSILMILHFPFAVISSIAGGPFPSFYSPSAYRVLKHLDISIWVSLPLLLVSSMIAVVVIWGSVLFIAKSWRKDIGEPVFTSVLLFYAFLVFQSVFTLQAPTRYFLPVYPIFMLTVVYALSNISNWSKKAISVYLVICLIYSAVLLGIDRPGKSFKPNARSVSMEILEQCKDSETGLGYLIVPDITELAIYDFYLKDSICEIIYQPRYFKFFVNRDWNALFASEGDIAQENLWFENVIKKQSKADHTEVIFIVSERQKDRAEQLSKLRIFNDYKKQSKTVDTIQVIRLDG